jgi:toxin YoeB
MYVVAFQISGWEDYSYWKTQDRKTLKKIDSIIKELFKTPFEGIGKPEQLKGNLAGFWSRRIDEKNRIIYSVAGDLVFVIACHGHYEDK